MSIKRYCSFGMKGKHHSEKTKEKMRKSAKDNWSNPDYKLSRSGENHPMFGKVGAMRGRKGIDHPRYKKVSPMKGRTGSLSPLWGRKHTLETKTKMKESALQLWDDPKYKAEHNWAKGEQNGAWKGGISKEPYGLVFDKQLKLFVKIRDQNRCQNPICNNNSRRLVIHHINYGKKNNLLFNLITLCIACNTKANRNRDYWKSFYQQINSKRRANEKGTIIKRD